MIPDIKEVYFPKDENEKQYATLSSAQVAQSDMGDKTIVATVKIDGQIVPDFSEDWVVEFQGERYIHPLRKPQASKENTDIRSSIDLTFRHWAIVELQRYFFVQMAPITAGTAVPDKFVAPLTLTLPNFIIALNEVLEYWYGDRIRAELHPTWIAAAEPTTINISYTHIWNLLTSDELYKAYGCRWQMVTERGGDGVHRAVIQFGFPSLKIDHIFEYGFKGGLLKVERQVQSDDIRNIILGRGGEKNVPYRYFKRIDPNNPTFAADPDWVFELENIYFDRIRDAAFRSYVQGWKYSHWNEYESLPEEERGQRVSRERAAVAWAWDMGATDSKFNPVEYVKDDESIAKYGKRWGALDDDDGTYPTIQGIVRDGLGRVDQVVAVGEVVTNEEALSSSSGSAAISEVPAFKGTAKVTLGTDAKRYTGSHEMRIPIAFYTDSTQTARQSTMTVPSEKVANFLLESPTTKVAVRAIGQTSGDKSTWVAGYTTSVEFKRVGTNETHTAVDIPEGEWTAEVVVKFDYNIPVDLSNYIIVEANFTFEFADARIQIGDDTSSRQKKYANTFDIWVKNIWDTTRGEKETAEDYAERVWRPILGDREGGTARVVFSTGWLSISEDYEFELPENIATAVHYDTTRRLVERDAEGRPTGNVYQSEWRLTLACSQADFDTLGVLIPNERTHADAGDFFFFIGIDLPYLYYTEAEKRVTYNKQDKLKEVADINPTWVVNLDKVRIGRQQYDDIAPLLSQLRVGASIRLTDPRFLQSVETLYIKSITYTYNEPTNDDPYIVPDVEIVLADGYEATPNPIGQLQGEVNALQKQVGSISNIEQIVRIIADRLYLRKDGIEDISYSPTLFNSLVTSKDFRMGGIGGAGWGIYRDANGNAVIEVDRAVVRQDLDVNNLVVNQTSARGGTIVESAAAMVCSLVVDNPDGYYCYFDQKQGSIGNLFMVDDVAYCNRWDAQNNEIKFYKRRVTAVGTDYIVLTKGYEADEKGDTGVNGTGLPDIDDNIIQYGNYTIPSRRFVIVRDVVGGGYERFIDNLDSVNATGEEYYFVGKMGDEPYRQTIGKKSKGRYLEYTEDDGLVVQGKISSKSTYDESDTELGEVILKSVPYFCKWSSNSNVPEPPEYRDGIIIVKYWSLDYPTNIGDYYVWQCDAEYRVDGRVTFSIPVCLTGRDGKDGAPGEQGPPGAPGAPGVSAYVLDLSNEIEGIPCDANGRPYQSLSNIYSKATVYYGASVDDGWTFEGTFVGCRGSVNANGEISITSMSADTATITVTAKKASITLTAEMKLYKVRDGENGTPATVYEVQPEYSAIQRGKDGNLIQKTITFTKYKTVGDNPREETDEVALFLQVEMNDGTVTSVWSPSKIGQGNGYTLPIDSNARNIIAMLYDSDSTSGNMLDRESVPVISDGEDGANGENAYTIDLTREMVAIPCDANGRPLSSAEITFKAIIYSGTKEAAGFKFTNTTYEGFSGDPTRLVGNEFFVDPMMLTNETGTITIHANNGSIYLETVFTLYKVLPGADGKSPTIYSLGASALAVVKSQTGGYYPTELVITRYENNAEYGLRESKANYVFVKRVGLDTTFTSPYLTPSSSASSFTLPYQNTVTAYEIELRDNGSSNYKVLDRLNIPVLSDAGQIEVGGVNLLLNTNQGSRGWRAYHSANNGFRIESDNNSRGVKWTNESVTTSTGSYWQFCQYAIPLGAVQKGKTYTLSFFADGTLSTGGIVDMTGALARNTQGDIVLYLDNNRAFELAGNKVVIRFNIPETSNFDPSTQQLFLQLSATAAQQTSWRTIRIWDLMLERGNVATDWQPSPYDVDYLTSALKEDGSIEGGLILGSLIRLGYTQANGEYRVMSGLNGIYNESESTGGPAFWAGGEMKDAVEYPNDANHATSLIRMDGTGYMANNNIRFNKDSVELGKDLVLADGILTLNNGGNVCVRLNNESMPADLDKFASSVVTVSGSGGLASETLRVAADGGVYVDSGKTEVSLSPIVLSNMTVGATANIAIKISFTLVDNVAAFSPHNISAQATMWDRSSGIWLFEQEGGRIVCNLYLQNVKIQSASTGISLTLYVGTKLQGSELASDAYTSADAEGRIQASGANMTIVGNDGIFSSWDKTAFGVNQSMAIMRAGNFGVQVDVNNGIRMMLDGSKWYTLSRSSDGTLRLT